MPLPQEPSVERRGFVGVGDVVEGLERVLVANVVEVVARVNEDDAGRLLDDREAVGSS